MHLEGCMCYLEEIFALSEQIHLHKSSAHCTYLLVKFLYLNSTDRLTLILTAQMHYNLVLMLAKLKLNHQAPRERKISEKTTNDIFALAIVIELMK